MSLSADIQTAKKAVDKLNTYMDGVFAAGGRDATVKYQQLNRLANQAVDKLPPGILRTRLGLDLASAVAKYKSALDRD